MLRALAVVIVLLLGAGGVSAYQLATDDSSTTGAAGTVETGVDGSLGGRAPARPGPGQVRVTGVVRDLDAASATLSPLPFPLTLEAIERGAGRARIEPATVDGKPGAAIVWDSGRPLPISGPGSLDLAGPAALTLADGQLRAVLDGAARAFPPGTFTVGATVAVGRAGLAQPRDTVAFGTDGTTVQTSGQVFVAVAEPLRFEGPTPLTVRGKLTMEHHDGEVVQVSGVDFAGGPLVVELTPFDGGWRIDALLQGAVVAVC